MALREDPVIGAQTTMAMHFKLHYQKKKNVHEMQYNKSITIEITHIAKDAAQKNKTEWKQTQKHT